MVLAKDESLARYGEVEKISLGSNLEEVSRNVFSVLRKVDCYGAKLVIIEGVSPSRTWACYNE